MGDCLYIITFACDWPKIVEKENENLIEKVEEEERKLHKKK